MANIMFVLDILFDPNSLVGKKDFFFFKEEEKLIKMELFWKSHIRK